MKLNFEVKSWNEYSPKHTSGEGVGVLLDLFCTQGHLLMHAKLFSGTTKCQKYIVSKNKPVWIR